MNTPKTPLGFLKLLFSREQEIKQQNLQVKFAKQDDIPNKAKSILLKHKLIEGTHAFGFVVSESAEELCTDIE